MTRYFCDRCGSDLTNTKEKVNILFNHERFISETKCFLVCPGCAKDIMNYMRLKED